MNGVNRMKQTAKLTLILCLGLAGCVERRMTIVSDPPGAAVTVNGHDIGVTPVDVPSHLFIYYGNYDFKLFKDGYEPQLVKQAVPAPWYQCPGLDFFSENVVPWHIKDRHVFTYQLVPNTIVPTDTLVGNANNLRDRGQTIGPAFEAMPPSPARLGNALLDP